MRRRQRQRKQGMSPVAAVAMLIACAAVAFVSLRSGFGGGGDARVGDAPGALLDDEEPIADAAIGDEEIGVDLLLRHGSWQAGTPVRMAFVGLVGAAIPAAPMGETANATTQRWIGADPPSLKLGVVLVGDKARRAVVDGRVVGLGDVIGHALVVAIERDALVVTWGGKRLTYDLDGVHPREFRAELQRRGIDPNESAAARAAGPGEPEEEQ